MPKTSTILLPNSEIILEQLGENIRLARLRRRLSAEQVSDRASISRPTLSSIEKGRPSVSIGSYLQVLLILGLEHDFLKVAADDVLGRKLQDAKLLTKKRAPKKAKPLTYHE